MKFFKKHGDNIPSTFLAKLFKNLVFLLLKKILSSDELLQLQNYVWSFWLSFVLWFGCVGFELRFTVQRCK